MDTKAATAIINGTKTFAAEQDLVKKKLQLSLKNMLQSILDGK